MYYLKSPARNKVGQKNLDNLKKLGVDHIDFSINPKVEKYFTLKAFKKFGILYSNAYGNACYYCENSN